MKPIFYASAPAFLGLPEPWRDGTLVEIGGVTVVENPDKTIVSVQPDGTIQTRPAGTTGIWEACTIDTSVNVLRYAGTGIPYALPYRGR